MKHGETISPPVFAAKSRKSKYVSAGNGKKCQQLEQC